MLLAPRRVIRAFQRGRRCTSLYDTGVGADSGEQAVSGLRQRLGLETSA
jgi:hypothetical protein